MGQETRKQKWGIEAAEMSESGAWVGYSPGFLLGDHPAADSRLPLIWSVEGLHPFLAEGGRTDDES